MAFAFGLGDLLIIEEVPLSDIRCGDVLIYRKAGRNGGGDEVVHRALASTPDGFVVQGDNNLHPDETLVTERNLVGRVTHVERKGKRRRIRCKRSGLLFSRFYHGCLHVRRLMLRAVRGMGCRPYGWLCKSGLIDRLWRPPVVKVRLLTPSGLVIKYIRRNRTVATIGWMRDGSSAVNLMIW